MNEEMQDPCENERQELEEARQGLQEHEANPLDWDMQDEPYQSRLRELQEAVVQAEKTLRNCEENASISN